MIGDVEEVCALWTCAVSKVSRIMIMSVSLRIVLGNLVWLVDIGLVSVDIFK